MFGIGAPELIIIAIIVFILFGAKRLPEIGKGLGGAIREFKQVKKDITQEDVKASPESGKDPKLLAGATVENAVKDKVAEQIPGVKKVLDMKRKVDKAKDFINS